MPQVQVLSLRPKMPFRISGRAFLICKRKDLNIKKATSVRQNIPEVCFVQTDDFVISLNRGRETKGVFRSTFMTTNSLKTMTVLVLSLLIGAEIILAQIREKTKIIIALFYKF